MGRWEYGHSVALVLVAAVSGLAALAVGRWWVLGLGPLVFIAAALLAAVSGTGIRDTPALFLGAVVIAACLVGVVLRQRLASPSI
jgi:hypothetical protein